MPCSVDTCEGLRYSKGFCRKHYERFNRYGDPLAGGPFRDRPLGEPRRFYEEVVLKYEGDECLMWPYGNANGYGKVYIDGVQLIVSRRLCEDINGPPPEDRPFAAHSCGNGHLGCVTKKHLSWKSPAENQADRLEHGTHNRGERHFNSKLTEQQVREILSLKGKETQAEIGKRYGVTRMTVADIHNGRRWAWIMREREFEAPEVRPQYSTLNSRQQFGAVIEGASL